MVTLKVIATGSRANCYQLTAGGASLLLDAGCHYNDLIRSTNGLRGLFGALVTHEHQDHIRCADKLARMGIKIYTSDGTARAASLSDWYSVSDRQQFIAGPFTIMPFRTEHDAAEPLGFLIRVGGVTVLYATDTHYIRYRFPGVNWWLIECNYVDELVEAMDNDALRKRLLQSHMGLNRLKELFGANDLSATKGIILCHLSRDRSDEARMVSEIQDLTGKATLAADAGMEVELCK